MEVNISDKERAQVGADLFDLARMVGAVHVGIMGLEILAHRGGFDFSPIKSRVDESVALLGQAGDKCTAVSRTLYRAKIPVRPDAAAVPKPAVNELSTLATYGSDDSRELLDLLERAQAVAERIDISRGHAVDEKMPLQPFESRGTDLSESISVLALRVRREAEGGQSRHE